MMQLMRMGMMFECIIFLTRHGHGDDNAIIGAIIVNHGLAGIWFWGFGIICHKIHDAVIRFPQTPCAQLEC